MITVFIFLSLSYFSDENYSYPLFMSWIQLFSVERSSDLIFDPKVWKKTEERLRKTAISHQILVSMLMLAIISLNSPHNVFSNCPLWATERNQPEKMAEGNRFSPPQIDTSSPSRLSDWTQLHQLRKNKI